MARTRKPTPPTETPPVFPYCLFPEAFQIDPKIAAVREQRGPITSALMKSIRLGREEDALFWMLALYRAGVDRGYLSRRCFGSACEDNLSLQPIEMGSELVRRPSRHCDDPYYQSVLASCRGLKWYQPFGMDYMLSFCHVWEGPRSLRCKTEEEVLEIAAHAIATWNVHDLIRAHRELQERRRGCFVLLDLLIEAASRRDVRTQRLAAVCARHKWLIVVRDMNPAMQLIWHLCEGPFAGCEESVPFDGLNQVLKAVEARWAAPDLEPVPSWALDGIHTKVGSDRRFAGDWLGARNMIAMHTRFGRLSPDDPGVHVSAGNANAEAIHTEHRGREWKEAV